MTTETKSRLFAAAHTAKRIPGAMWRRYKKLNTFGKTLVWCMAIFEICLVVVIIVLTPARIAQFLYDLAHRVSQHPAGWLAFAAVVALTSLPPLIGHTTFTTLCGFAYGMKGILIAGPASSIGSALVFILLRTLFSKRLAAWSRANDKWQALETVIRERGLPLIILIRMSPLPPWIWANILFASIEAVSLWHFVIATFFYWPKLLLHVFIGSRAAALADGEQRKNMDTQTKVLNSLLIAFGIVVGIVAGAVMYRFMKRQLHTVEAAEEVIDDIDEGAPLLRDFSPVRAEHGRSRSPMGRKRGEEEEEGYEV